jgi:pimeloyl-ACP methyl ester carboxylesterase
MARMDFKRILKRMVLAWLAVGTISLANAASLLPCVNWPSSDFQPIANKKTGVIAPDYGLYWFKMSKGKYPEAVKKAYTPASLEPYFSNGTRNPNPNPTQATSYQRAKAAYEKKLIKAGYFNPAKPTVIFIHGWNPSSTINKKRFDFCYQYKTSATTYSPRYNTLKYFKQKGWNVAVFYWNQFSDDHLSHAEGKIYTSLNPAPRSWAYLNVHNQLEYCANSLSKHCMALPDNALSKPASITHLAFKAYTNALPSNYHQTVHIVGFSLGTQVAIQLTNLILQTPAAPQASRLTLLDPYFSYNQPSGLANKIPQYNYNTLRSIINTAAQQHQALAISMYRTSPLSSAAYAKLILENPDVSQHIAYEKLEPKYLNPAYEDNMLMALHVSAPYLYFQSMKSSPVYHCDEEDCSHTYIDAASSNVQIETLAGQKRFQQPDALLPSKDTSEHDFPDTQDDVFSAKPVLSQK